MYTRCPSCRAEISFEPPANAANLPEGYKHRIKCPSCGVTIGVKIPRVDTTATIYPTYNPANPNATAFEPVYQANAATVPASYAPAKPAKKAGTARNIVMLLFSLVFIAFSVIGYLVSKGTIEFNNALLGAFTITNGIGVWELVVTNGSIIFQHGILNGVLTLVPLILFTVAGINALIAIICLFCKKYSRVYNLIASIIMGAFACLCLFLPYLSMIDVGVQIAIGDYFTDYIIGGEQYFLLVCAILGLLQFIFSLIFLKSMEKRLV